MKNARDTLIGRTVSIVTPYAKYSIGKVVKIWAVVKYGDKWLVTMETADGKKYPRYATDIKVR